ncbi:MAG: HutP family protein [Acidaminococcaceae bacterium]|nr:HutP family protein [Acidaminococcaceae bacterium]
MLLNSIRDVGSAAMALSLTNSILDENQVKQFLLENGYLCAVTEVGGNTLQETFQEKTTKAVIGAALNNNIVEKEAYQIHAILHATMEAKQGILVNVSTSANIAIKIAIVRKEGWVAVAMFGESAVHHLTNHERAGLGIMHI